MQGAKAARVSRFASPLQWAVFTVAATILIVICGHLATQVGVRGFHVDLSGVDWLSPPQAKSKAQVTKTKFEGSYRLKSINVPELIQRDGIEFATAKYMDLQALASTSDLSALNLTDSQIQQLADILPHEPSEVDRTSVIAIPDNMEELQAVHAQVMTILNRNQRATLRNMATTSKDRQSSR
jgi:hypothetical protein